MNKKFFVSRVILCWIVLSVLELFAFSFVYRISWRVSDFVRPFVDWKPIIEHVVCGGIFFFILTEVMSYVHTFLTLLCSFISRDDIEIIPKAVIGEGITFSLFGLYGVVIDPVARLFAICMILYGVFYAYLGFSADRSN